MMLIGKRKTCPHRTIISSNEVLSNLSPFLFATFWSEIFYFICLNVLFAGLADMALARVNDFVVAVRGTCFRGSGILLIQWDFYYFSYSVSSCRAIEPYACHKRSYSVVRQHHTSTQSILRYLFKQVFATRFCGISVTLLIVMRFQRTHGSGICYILYYQA